ncbi:hypothetical protein BST95_09025 [Halioglobus japonicus]|uniref:DUF2779 domain-containing protein n=1 Tax=Halioglobus japonicus TaxID=930805 RepID=A0AAP8SNE0_9GAMM|nr:DUF2779 domain-containing protein [Halioglobus japonicus]AQA18353.1 hypothetical protein BST95_09025 [Halioglobus japonicus]PLW86371.1 DUF2779 domain-containing protein [Halioglobus japonicus]GHD13229.1 hypothetical protein GCM10007052_15130 [Halioglobus japonicus]
MTNGPVLSKTRFMAGHQCPLQLWFKVNEKNAPELEIDEVARVRMDSGTRVGNVARNYYPGGLLIEGERYEYEKKCALTQEAIDAGTTVIYEAAFEHENTFVAIDILELEADGWVIREVKSSTGVKDEHIPDIAVQLMTARAAGLQVGRAEVVFLNRDCKYPDLSNLFATEDVTTRVEELLADLAVLERRLQLVMIQEKPEIEPGGHCDTPRDCPFKARCVPELPEHHVSTLYRLGKEKARSLVAQGVHTVDQIGAEVKLSATAARQVDSVRTDQIVIEQGLRGELNTLSFPAAFLDFETVSMAIPEWDGCSPYTQVPVQFSCHVMAADGSIEHYEWLAEPGGDPRSALAEALVNACEGAASVVAYNAGFERSCIKGLVNVRPELESELLSIAGKLVDLLPIVRNNVYHPQFHGSFSIKSVLPALVPGAGYAELEVASGDVAALKLEQMMRGDLEGSTEELREALLKYCEMDTYAMVELYHRLLEVADQAAA